MGLSVLFLIFALLSDHGIRQTRCQTTQAKTYLYKSLAGPPSEFPSFTPPTFKDAGMHSRYYMLPPFVLKDVDQKWTHSIPVDYCDIFAVTLFAEEPKSFTMKFLLPNGTEVTANKVYDESMGYGQLALYPCTTLLFNDPVPSVGEWSITVTSVSSSYPVNVSLIASFYPSDLTLQAFVPTENLLVGQSVNIIASMPTSVSLGRGGDDNALRSTATLESAVAVIYLPNGNNETLEMEPTNIKRNAANNDLFASFEATMPGVYKNLVQVTGKLLDGTKFIRSLYYVFTIAQPSIEITGKVTGSLHTHDVSGRNIIDFKIPVKWFGEDLSFRAFAQVWGTGKNKEEVPVAWISGLVDVQRKKWCLFNCHYIHMQLDSHWLELVNATPPLTLKSLTLEELKAFIIVSKSDVLKVTVDDTLMKWSPSLKAEHVEIDWEMKEGYNPCRVKKMDIGTAEGQLLLLHGYCSTGDEFPVKYFDDYLLFRDESRQNYLHDEYARKVYDFVTKNDTTSLTSVYGHSQGGAVALHLYTYYITGLDCVMGCGRIIQTLGTPYRGTPLAGILAFLANLFFDYACGYNENLTYSGAERWLSKIPLETRKEVYYYTTQYPQDAPLFQRYCWLVTLLVLSPDNDGIVEVDRGLLPGGNQVENAEGECHIPGLEYPPQLCNMERSKEINACAARHCNSDGINC